MTTTQLQERIEKATLKIAKKSQTIAKKEILIEKKCEKVRSMGFTPDENGKKAARELGNTDVCWLIFDIESLKDDIERNEREIPEIEAMITKYRAMLAGEIEKENFLKTMPPIMHELENELFERWFRYDLDRKASLRESYRLAEQEGLAGHRAWMKKHKTAAYQFMHRSDEQLEKDNRDAAKAHVIDIYRRIYDKTGEITDYSGVTLQGHALNGLFIGKTGKVVAETILASGEVQRLHYRCIIHDIV